MHVNFEAEKNQKAALYTAIICIILLLLFYFITWSVKKMPPPPPMEDLIEVNLGNDKEGFGAEQPLIKGDRAPAQDPAPQPQTVAAANDAPAKDIETDDKPDDEAAAVKKVEKNNSKKIEAPKENVTKPIKTNPAPVTTPAPPKPQKPKFTYNGPGNGKGNGATEDNGYNNQGNNPNGKGDAGSPSGKPDSYGNTPGGKTAGGALRVSKGDRTIINNYIFMGDLPKATINAVIKVSADGRGTFISFDKGSTSTDPRYASAIRGYLPNIKFNSSDHESVVTVPFNFKVQ